MVQYLLVQFDTLPQPSACGYTYTRRCVHTHIWGEKKCRTQKGEWSFGSVVKVLAAQHTYSVQQGYLGLSGRDEIAELTKSVGKAKKEEKKEKKVFGLQTRLGDPKFSNKRVSKCRDYQVSKYKCFQKWVCLHCRLLTS